MPNNATTSLQSRIKGFLVFGAEGIKIHRIPVHDAEQVVQLWKRLVLDKYLGSSQLKRHAGDLVDENGKLVGHISYNGKIWSDRPTAKSRTLLFDPYAEGVL